MFKGIAFALGACLIWGLIFVVPSFMQGFTSVEIALARYFFYGLISLPIYVFMALRKGTVHYTRKIWYTAFKFTLLSSFIYYTCVVLALKNATPAISALILGVAPIAISVYGNWKERECSFKSLILPSIFILIGLILINIPHFYRNEQIKMHIWGLFCSIGALVSWTWYAVANARFLKRNPQIPTNEWATLMGMTNLFWVCLFASLLSLFFADHFGMEKYMTPSSELFDFIIGAAILGLLCSWVGGYFWNQACVFLPVSFAGQLTIFETLFGLLYVFTAEGRLPTLLECIGALLFFLAVGYSIHSFTRAPSRTEIH